MSNKFIIDVSRAIEQVSGVTFADICSHSRLRYINDARQLFSSILHKRGYTLKHIGTIIGRRSHSSVINQCSQHEADYQLCDEYRRLADRVYKLLNYHNDTK